MSEYGWFLASRRWLVQGRTGAAARCWWSWGSTRPTGPRSRCGNLLSSVGYHAYGRVTVTSLRQSRAAKAYLRHADGHLPQFAFERWTTARQSSISSTSIYGRIDGMVRWATCRCPAGYYPTISRMAVAPA